MPTLSISYIKEKWQHAGFQKYLKNTGWMFGGRFISLGISFFVGIYIARYLGPSNYGLLSYVTSFVGLFGLIISFGTDGVVSREIINCHEKKDELIGTSFYIRIVGSFIAIFCVLIVSIISTKDIFTLGLIWIFSLSFIPQAFNILEIYFQSNTLSRKVVIAQIISTTVSAILKITVIFLNKGIFWLTLIYIIEASIYSFILLYSFRKFGNYIRRRWKFSKSVAKMLLRDSWPLMLSSVAIGLYMKIDQVMIKNILGNEQAGIYAVVVKLSEVWYFIPVIICTSLFPTILQAMNRSKELFESRLRRLYSLMFWLSFIIASTTTFFANFIISVLFGVEYITAVLPLQIYIWAGISVFIGVALGKFLLASNLTKTSFYLSIIGAIINIILNIILIPKIGIEGAAIATLISYTLATFGIFFFKKSRHQGKLILQSILSYK